MTDLSMIPTSELKTELTRRRLCCAKLPPQDWERAAAVTIIAVATEFDVLIEDIDSATRVQPVVIARQVAMSLLRERGVSQQKLSNRFRRDRGTIIHADRLVINREIDDSDFADRLHMIRERIAKYLAN